MRRRDGHDSVCGFSMRNNSSELFSASVVFNLDQERRTDPRSGTMNRSFSLFNGEQRTAQRSTGLSCSFEPAPATRDVNIKGDKKSECMQIGEEDGQIRKHEGTD